METQDPPETNQITVYDLKKNIQIKVWSDLLTISLIPGLPGSLCGEPHGGTGWPLRTTQKHLAENEGWVLNLAQDHMEKTI